MLLFSDVVAVSDLNKNFGGSTGLAKKKYGSGDLLTPIHPPLLVTQQVYMCHVFRELNCNQTITVSWDEHVENLISIQHIYRKRNTFSFRNHEV